MKQTTSFLRRWFPSVQLRGSNGLGVVLLLGLLVALLLVPYVIEFEGRDQPERDVLQGLPFSSVLETLELRAYDSYFRDDENFQPKLRDKVAIIAIDQDSLSYQGIWPWPRRMYAELINRLHKAGARVIAIDIDFSDKQNPGPNGALSADDKALVAACENAKTVIFPSKFELGTVSNQQLLEGVGKDTVQLTSPFSEDYSGNPGLDETTADLGVNYIPQDRDGVVRRYPLAARVQDQLIGGFAALACAEYQKLGPGEEKSPYEAALHKGEWFSLKSGTYPVPLRLTSYIDRNHRASTEKPQYFEYLLKYRVPRSISTYSFSNFIGKDQVDDARVKKLFNDRIVFVGATASILKDIFPSPSGSNIAGVEIHAGAACQLLEGSYIEPPELQITLMNLFGLTILSALWPQVIRGRVSRIARRSQERWKARKRLKNLTFRVQDTIWFLLTGSLAILPAISFWGLCFVSFNERSIWTVMTYPILGSTASAALAMVYLFTLETAERRKVMHQVGLYLDPDIMETILAHPEEEYPKPRRTTATVMFTDLQGFTSYSESHSADEVVAALNAYMSRLQPIVKKHHGSVDKYIGDAIMAYFGVPVPRDDHATWALKCAIEIQEECCRFRADTGIPFFTRIGIHTGELIAGSIGSQTSSGSLIAYTVIGDTVNLASRLEAKNKDFGSWILCSKATVDAAPDVANVEAVSASIRGKSQEVEMFIVRGPSCEAPRDGMWAQAAQQIAAK